MGEIEHRQIFLPGANEALAEAALLDECSTHPAAFDNPPCVFSYKLCQGDERGGLFEPYFLGLKNRHEELVRACDACPDGIVRYADIKRFYPSVSSELALKAFRRQADSGGLAPRYRDLGEKLIEDHRNAQERDERGILTGPMLSHLLGNLVLRQLDFTCCRDMPARYFRYVDDITLVGKPHAVKESFNILRCSLAELGLELHDDSSHKSIVVSTAEWLESRSDFRESRRLISWMTFIRDLKQFLFVNSDKREHLRKAFRVEGLRLPIRDYSAAIRDASYLKNILHWSKSSWFKGKVHRISIEGLISQALSLRKSYEKEFRELMNETVSLSGFSRKRRIPKLRYRASRLIYLATEESLASLSTEAAEFAELRFHSEVMAAVESGNIDGLLSLGSNSAQAAAQPLRASGRRVTSASAKFGEAEEQGLAAFCLNGVAVERNVAIGQQGSELIRFATAGVDVALMKSNDPFMRELGCLHGLSNQARHPEILESAFDEDEALVMDAIDQIQQSFST